MAECPVCMCVRVLAVPPGAKTRACSGCCCLGAHLSNHRCHEERDDEEATGGDYMFARSIILRGQ